MKHPDSPSLHPLWRLTEWVGVLLYAALVFEMARLWIAPQPEHAERILTLVMLVVFEFILVHSGVFMSVMPRKVSLLVFVPFYGIFALAFNAFMPGNAILILYLGVILMRMRFAFSEPSDEARGQVMTISIIAAMLYFVLIFLFAFGGSLVPEFGLDSTFLQASGYFDLTNATGEFIDHPHIAIGMGTVYFTLLALLEIKVFGLLKPRK